MPADSALLVARPRSWEFGADERSGTAIQSAFRAYGFAVVRGVVTQPELAALRSELDRTFDSARLRGEPVMSNTEALACAAVWRCLFKESVVRSLRAALGPELYYHTDLHVQRNSFGQAGLQRHRGWHMDASSETHNEYLRSPEYRFAKCGIFLQDFDNGWGGGIRIKPKSHRRFFESNPLKRGLFLFEGFLTGRPSDCRWRLIPCKCPPGQGICASLTRDCCIAPYSRVPRTSEKSATTEKRMWVRSGRTYHEHRPST